MTPKTNRRVFLGAIGTAAAVTAGKLEALCATPTRVRIVNLKTDYLDRPLGLQNLHPRLSWQIESVERNVRQSAYRVLVSSTEAILNAGRGDLWDSGKVSCGRSFGVQYQGASVSSRQRCWWSVQVWDEKGLQSPVSSASWWEMGLLSPTDWSARWLAIEDPIAHVDREVGLNWIWGTADNSSLLRKFRLKFTLTVASRQGVLLAGGRHSPAIDRSDRLRAVWIDGVPVPLAPPPKAASVARPLSKIPLGPLGAGEHVFAAEVESVHLGTDHQFSAPAVGGFVAFARLELLNGQVLRLASGPDWKTSLTADSLWHDLTYVDESWNRSLSADLPPDAPWPPTPAMHLRKSFTIKKRITAARLYATALGVYEAHLNGKRVGDALLAPEVTQFRKRLLYQTYDVSALLQSGENVLGLTVGDGWYASPITIGGRYSWGVPPRRVMAQLEMIFEDGSTQTVTTQPKWRISNSAIVSSEIYDGEVYDARLAQPGWNQVGFNDADWFLALEAEPPPCELTSQICPPVLATQSFRPRSINSPKRGVYVFDFGQNVAGWCRLRVQGIAGTRIELRHAEILAPSGEVDQANLAAAKATDVYILRGGSAEETFEPHFTYHGFRYVQVTGLPSPPDEKTLEGIVVHSDLPVTGTLRIDNPVIERIWRAAVWTQRSNFVAIPTDCPQRDERLGWMGDAGSFWDSASFNMDVSAFTRKQMDNVRDDQTTEGAFPILSPEARPFNEEQEGPTPGWGDGGFILPWIAWQRYGDIGVIEQNWNSMARHVDYVLSHNPDYVWRQKCGYNLGDWLAVDAKEPDDPTTPKDLVSTAFLAHSVDLLSQMAAALGRSEDAVRLRAIYERVRAAFIANFVKSDGRIGNESQTSYILALRFGLVPGILLVSAQERLANAVRLRGTSLSTGILGTPYALDALADAGYTELAYDLLLRTEFPSWGYMIKKGGTTIWERWNGDVRGVDMNSQNHYALGSFVGFLFRRIAGIDAAMPGFESIVVRPIVSSRVKHGGGNYHSIMGCISTDWSQHDNGSFSLNLTVPANTSARVHLPATPRARIHEGRREISSCNELRQISRSSKEAILDVGSGSYRFFVKG